MKTKVMMVAGLIIGLFACSEDSVTSLSPVWGIEFSSPGTADLASGMISKGQSASKDSYFVDRAQLQTISQEDYKLTLVFTSGDSLEFMISKRIAGESFQFPEVEGQNSLVYSNFNSSRLTLKESTLTIQPKRGENKVYATLDIHTAEGDFTGTASKIPLIGVLH